MKMRILDGDYGICRFNIEEEVNNFGYKSEFYSFTKTDDEISVVCESKYIPEEVQHKAGWKVFKIVEQLDFSLVGILAKLSTLMAENNISIFALSTYDTDYLLIKEVDSFEAAKLLINAGYELKCNLF